MKIISFSLWGFQPIYCVGAVKNTEIAYTVYPEWKCRFYCGKQTDKKCIEDLNNMDNCEIINMNEDGDWSSMFWRFFAADSDDIVISRDTDSRLNEREKVAVDEWLNSNYNFHIMRDHPWHNNIILGGMWGVRHGILKGITDAVKEYHKSNEFINDYGVDQNFLKSYVYSRIEDSVKIHDPFFNNLPFPTPRKNRQFVGQPFNADDTERDPQHGDMILQSGK